MRKNIFIILFFCVLLVYIIFFPQQLKKELVIHPSWGIELEKAAEYQGNIPIPFSFNSKLGYFSAAGSMIYSENVNYNVAISEEVFINYSSVSQTLVLQEADGDIINVIESEGFPFFNNNRLFVISPDRMMLTEYTHQGILIQSFSPGSAITSMDAGDKSVIIGMLNGKVAVYTDSSEPEFTYFSTDSRYSVTYACALSDDGSRFAAVIGLYPQQLVCFEMRNNIYTPVFRMNIAEAFRGNLLLDYSDDGRLMFMESRSGLDVYSTATFLKKQIVTDGQISSVIFPGEKEISYIVTEQEDSNMIRIYRSDLGELAELYFPPGDIYFHSAEDCFYVGVAGRILRYDLIEG